MLTALRSPDSKILLALCPSPVLGTKADSQGKIKQVQLVPFSRGTRGKTALGCSLSQTSFSVLAV